MEMKTETIRIQPLDQKNTPILLTPEALNFLEKLHTQFNSEREQLLALRTIRQKELDRGLRLDFLKDTASIRQAKWQVAPAPADLNDRRVEITGPAERKMMINALNSGAQVFMVDLEDALSPTWENIIQGQFNLRDAVRRNLSYTSLEGKHYTLQEKTATLVVRPRGWHLTEKNILVGGKRISASLCDFGLFFFHNAKELIKRGSAPYFYLPKMESHLEARLWNKVFVKAQEWLGIPQGTIRATVLIETYPAAFEMEEILFELKEHAAGLNAGRWDYIFSVIKKYHKSPDFILPDRVQINMTVPFMKSYADLLVHTCHKRGAHAIGGMAAFIPSRKDAEVNKTAFSKVREDKTREANAGFDGTWVAHPDLVPVAAESFNLKFKTNPHQKDILREDVTREANALLDVKNTGAKITEDGFRLNINVALQYIERWLGGLGAVAIHGLMEDAATAEISRSQLWQWIHHSAKLDDGRTANKELFQKLLKEELQNLSGGEGAGKYRESAQVLEDLALSEVFTDFLTLPAYEKLL